MFCAEYVFPEGAQFGSLHIGSNSTITLMNIASMLDFSYIFFHLLYLDFTTLLFLSFFLFKLGVSSTMYSGPSLFIKAGGVLNLINVYSMFSLSVILFTHQPPTPKPQPLASPLLLQLFINFFIFLFHFPQTAKIRWTSLVCHPVKDESTFIHLVCTSLVARCIVSLIIEKHEERKGKATRNKEGRKGRRFKKVHLTYHS